METDVKLTNKFSLSARSKCIPFQQMKIKLQEVKHLLVSSLVCPNVFNLQLQK